MFPPRWFAPYDVVIQLVMALVSIGIAVFAYQGFQWVKEKSLYYLSMAFGLLAIGFFAIGITLFYSMLVPTPGPFEAMPLPIIDLGFWLYYLFSIAAFGILVYAYSKKLRGVPIALAAFGAGLSSFAPFLETVVIFLILLVLVAQAAHYMRHRTRLGLAVMTSFAFILLSHLLILTSGFESLQYVMGKVIQLGSFVVLFIVLLSMRGPNE
jgi:hypothetical protein